MLPKLPNRDKIRKTQTMTFSGVNRNPAAPDGSIFSTVNMDTDRAPLLAPRRRRKIIRRTGESDVYGMIAHNGLIWIEGSTVRHNGSIIGENHTPGTKQLAVMNNWLIIFPDKMMISLDPERRQEPDFGEVPMEKTLTGIVATIEDGTYADDYAEKNTIWARDMEWEKAGFQVGDTITISGAQDPRNNLTVTVRELHYKELRFYPNTFEAVSPDLWSESLTIHRTVPDFERIFVHENRLWAWKGNTIYCSVLGNPTGWLKYDNISTDAWTVELDGPGEITGAIVYQGYPTFFKEDRVYRIYGDQPSQYRFMESSTLGVLRGCADSLAIAGDTLYYLGPQGMTRFNGGYARNIHEPFGELKFSRAAAVSDGIRYYVNLGIGERTAETWVYDTKWESWYRWDYEIDDHMASDAGAVFMTDNSRGQILIDGRAFVPDWVESWEEEEQYGSMVEFGDFTGANWSSGRNTGNPNRKGTGKLQLRLTIEENTTLRVYIQSNNESILVKELVGDGRKDSHYLPIIPRRSDNYRIRIVADGDWTLHSLVREEYSGSEIF